LIAIHVAFLALFDLGHAPRVFLGLLAAAFVAYGWAVLRLEAHVGAAMSLVVAAVLRLLVLPIPPTLSDDILRYQWDGRVAMAGKNPYLLAPEAAELTPLRDALWHSMPHKDVPSVYPPGALGLFSIASRAPQPAWAIKILLTIADLVGCWLLLRLAAARGAPPGRALWYAWNPLVVLEIAGMGHVDGLMVPAMIATVWLLVRTRTRVRPRLAGAAAAFGVLVKLVPLVALPMWARQSRSPLRFSIAAGVVIGVVLAPVVVSTAGVPLGLVTYGVSWEFDGPLYEPLWRGIDAVDLDLWVKGRLDALKQQTGWHQQLNHLYPWVYPQLLAKLMLAALLAVLFGVSLRIRDPVRGSRWLFGALIVCSATVYPWYLLWVLPWAALERDRAWLVLSATIGLSYLPQTSSVALMPWTYLAIWSPPLLVSWITRRWSSN